MTAHAHMLCPCRMFPRTAVLLRGATGDAHSPGVGEGSHREGETKAAPLASGDSALGVRSVQPVQGNHQTDGRKHVAGKETIREMEESMLQVMNENSECVVTSGNANIIL